MLIAISSLAMLGKLDIKKKRIQFSAIVVYIFSMYRNPHRFPLSVVYVVSFILGNDNGLFKLYCHECNLYEVAD